MANSLHHWSAGETSPAPSGSGGEKTSQGKKRPAPSGSGGEDASQGMKCQAAPGSEGERKWKKVQADQERNKIMDIYRPLPETEIKFDGGRAAVLPPHKCDTCGEYFAVASCLVMCTQKGDVPYMNPGLVSSLLSRMRQVVTGEPPPAFSNWLDPSVHADTDNQVLSCCYRCYGEKVHGNINHYLKNDEETGRSKVTSEFFNLRKRNQGRSEKEEQSTCKNLFEKACKEHPEHEVSLGEVYLEICKTPALAVAADFIVTLGPDCYIQYTCTFCKEFPANPKWWLRCVPQSMSQLPGGTQQNGHWRCPRADCCGRWTWRKGGCQRVLILPPHKASSPASTESGAAKKSDTESSPAPAGSGAGALRMAIIGKCTPEQDHIINLIKAGKLVQQIRTKDGSTVELGIPALVRAIDRLNILAENRLLQSFPSISRKACDWDDLRNHQVTPYCENEALSLRWLGAYYKSISIPDDTPTMEDGVRQELLDTLLCFFNLDNCRPKNKGELMTAWKKARATQERQRNQIFFTETELQKREDFVTRELVS